MVKINLPKWLDYREIKRWLWNEVGYPIKAFFRQIKHVCKWLPVLWQDRDWDYRYIYTVLRFKLERTQKCIKDYDRFVGVEYVTRDIGWCIEILKKLEDDVYETEYFDYCEFNIEFIPVGEKGFKMESTEVWNKYDTYINLNKNIARNLLKSEPDLINNKYRYCRKIAEAKHAKAKRILFTIIERKIQYWWD